MARTSWKLCSNTRCKGPSSRVRRNCAQRAGTSRPGDVARARRAQDLFLQVPERARAQPELVEPPRRVHEVQVRHLLPGAAQAVERAPAGQQRQVEALSVEGDDRALARKQRQQPAQQVLLLVVVAQVELRDPHLFSKDFAHAHFKGDGADAPGQPRGLRVQKEQVLRRKAQARKRPPRP